jgi:AraC-like DNA-binding protein
MHDMPPEAAHTDIAIELASQPLSPWLRLAHRTVIGSDGSGRGVLRTCDDWMLMFQLEGTGFIWWHELGGSVALPPGAVACVPPGRVHAWGVVPGAHIAVHFDLHAQPALEPFDMLHHQQQLVEPRPLPAMPVLSLRLAGRTEPLRIALVTRLRRPRAWRERLDPLVAMYGARAHRGLPARMRATGILTDALLSLARDEDEAPAGDAPDPRIVALLGELDADCARPWRVGTLARRAGMGVTAFRRAFAQATGAQPRAHLESLRMDRAMRLLIDTDSTIAAVGQAVGYGDPYHFSRVFRRVTGRTPSAVRRREP